VITESGVDYEPDQPALAGRSRRWTFPLLVVGGLAVAVLVAGYFLVSPNDSEPSLDDFLTRAESGIARVDVQRGDVGVPTAADGRVQLSDDLYLAVSVNPDPPTSLALYLDLLLTDAAGRPIPNATIVGDWDMTVMSHGVVITEFLAEGNGHYTAPVRGIMFGLWTLVTTVTAPGFDVPDPVTISIYVWPE